MSEQGYQPKGADDIDLSNPPSVRDFEAADMWGWALSEKLDQMRAAILALAGELDGQAIPQMGPGAIAKRLRQIAG